MTTYIYSAIAGLFLAATILLLQPGAPAAEQPQIVIEESAPAAGDWRTDLLAALGNTQPTADTIAFLDAWHQAEGGTAAFNPLNTTQEAPGATCYNADPCVKDYPDYQTGLQATIATLASDYPGYAEIVAGLQTNDPDRALAGISASPWGTHAGTIAEVYGQSAPAAAMAPAPDTQQAFEILPRNASATATKCPYTREMTYPENSQFNSTGSWAWEGQYGGMHLGVDFTGEVGDPVFAPFAMTIEAVGEYTDAARLGKNIQARFSADNTLYYAGHLVDVYVQAGQTVAPCDVIGTLGATTATPHTHIKLASPGAPVPCEGSAPGPGGCIDPMEYWNTH